LQGSGSVPRSAILGRSIRIEDRERDGIDAIRFWVAIPFVAFQFPLAILKIWNSKRKNSKSKRYIWAY
jgi:hypothetical protein